jgi:CcmD family protein
MNYLVAAYAAIWFLFFIYLFTLKSRQKNLEKTVEALQKQLDRR